MLIISLLELILTAIKSTLNRLTIYGHLLDFVEGQALLQHIRKCDVIAAVISYIIS